MEKQRSLNATEYDIVDYDPHTEELFTTMDQNSALEIQLQKELFELIQSNDKFEERNVVGKLEHLEKHEDTIALMWEVRQLNERICQADETVVNRYRIAGIAKGLEGEEQVDLSESFAFL